MTSQKPADSTPESASQRKARLEALEKRRRAERLLGGSWSVAPDETDEGWGDAFRDGGESARDAQLLRDVPPHHG